MQSYKQENRPVGQEFKICTTASSKASTLGKTWNTTIRAYDAETSNWGISYNSLFIIKKQTKKDFYPCETKTDLMIKSLKSLKSIELKKQDTYISWSSFF